MNNIKITYLYLVDLKLTLIQSDLHWEDVDANLSMFAEKIASAPKETDIIILPEMFNTGFSMESEKLAETMDGKSVTWLKEQAQKSQAIIIASLIIKENNLLSGGTKGGFFNRLIWADPNGTVQHYDKRHLFRMAGEHEHFDAGQERLIVEYKGWRICPLICYDLRFPVWSRNVTLPVDACHPEFIEGQTTNAFDLLIYIANWPAARKSPWSKLLEARAIENQCFVVGLNRVGQDGKHIEYSGNSAVIDPKGDIISSIPESANHLQTVSISLDELNDFREKFPVGMDADEFKLF